MLGDAPVLVHSARAAIAHTSVRWLVVAVPAGEVAVVDAMLRSFRVDERVSVTVVEGGATRQASVAAAVAVVAPDADMVIVHDAARPFLPAGRLEAVLESAAAAGAAALALPVADTLRRARAGEFGETVDREALWAMQTPQAARRELLRRAVESAEREHFNATDEVAVLERAGVGVRLVEGDPLNYKVTTELDWAMAQALVRASGRA